MRSNTASVWRLVAINTLVFIATLLILEFISFGILSRTGNHCTPVYCKSQRNVMPAHPVLGWTNNMVKATQSGGIQIPGWIFYPSGISSSDTLRLAIVGGSTSDNVFQPDNWPIKLQKILESNGVAVSLYNGATAGYSSNQELSVVKNYLQDIKPHFLISYSGVNECVNFKRLNNQITFSTGLANNQLLPNLLVAASKIRDRKRKNDFGGCHGKDGQELALQWLSNMGEMNSIAKTNGVQFISIIQPSVVTLNPRKVEFENDISISDYLTTFYAVVNKNRQSKNFIFDLTHIFNDSPDVYLDDCHVTDEGNRIVAKQVYDVLETYRISNVLAGQSMMTIDEK